MSDTLSEDTIHESLPADWEYDGTEILRTVEFDSYLDGVAFAREVAELADEAFHHPRIVIEFRAVTVAFTSHEAGGVTEQDLELAARVNDLD
ncbi:pterin-4-alpha-carbinolamine dehydratase [Halodesulfurarchaeum formicicum]|uniref:4a-hydroxytetrahydrobiopterin dehydratase n=1 Tax=Halodesulfurarchaeum formicicum TaxID=1873524 RepID=A0A1D8S2M6_9EURY|nr:4a-hydroxytetrahydrobiopterin dehydratase [Halodesulfurarchaeum formicicum]AOW79609.1 pterin-4-alpha-carbinolamine dehydratase [Halodesulfurarchaeum formicicum]APE94860.1 pterin-4-alpha-carbinolamine dehydratase [Halodesulfurarchaeum formicicum]